MRYLLAFSVGLAAASARADEPTLTLFDGKSLDGWVIDGPKEVKDKAGTVTPNWQVRDGFIVGGGSFGFLRYDKKQFADFALHVEYRLEKGGNSGLGIRTGVFDPKKSRETRPSFFSYEIQILDDAGLPANEHCSGSLYRYVAPKKIAVKASPAWNTYDVECVGPRITITINGELVIDFDQTTKPELKDKPLKGYVCLQSHSKQVEFRSVRLREIKPTRGQ